MGESQPTGCEALHKVQYADVVYTVRARQVDACTLPGQQHRTDGTADPVMEHRQVMSDLNPKRGHQVFRKMEIEARSCSFIVDKSIYGGFIQIQTLHMTHVPSF
jgi:hypothetical protein